MPQPIPQNFNAMRQDAIRRSKEMQKKAVSAPPPPPLPPEPPVPSESKWDSEKLALLALLYLLYQDGAEPELLLALAYILL